MKRPEAEALLRVWEQGAHSSPVRRGLLLMTAVVPEQAPEELLHWNIGRRDRLLLDLRAELFGPVVRCLTECTRCSEAIELEFRTHEVSVSHGEPGRVYQAEAQGYAVRFRLPDSADLLTLEGLPAAAAERQLLARCVLEVRAPEGEGAAADLPEEALAAVSRGMSEADPQAEIVLDVACPACAAVSPAPFDILTHLWAELDAWARRLLREVHTLAQAYGWAEAEILRMSPMRRRAYLDLIQG